MEKSTAHFSTIQKAIEFIVEQKNAQPSLDQIAAHVNLSAFHFQRLFSEWAGISPKQFLQAITLQQAKGLLKQKSKTIVELSDAVGFSSSSRLHDLFIKVEAMSPANYSSGGKGLQIFYYSYQTRFGEALIASTAKGICFLMFFETNASAVEELKSTFFAATLLHEKSEQHQQAADAINGIVDNSKPLRLHLKGTAFQLKVWEALLTIPYSEVASYGELAQQLEMPKSARAVGTAIGSNLVAYIIPCHRVIQQSGAMGGYRWGLPRKRAMLALEQSQHE